MYLVLKCLSSGTLVSSDAKSAVIITAKQTLSVFFQLLLQLCLIPVPVCTCSFAGRVLNLAAWLQAGCASASMSVWVISAPAAALLPKSIYCRCKGTWTMETEETGPSLKPSPFAQQSLFPCKIWHLTLTRIQCGPAHIINSCEEETLLFPTSVKVSILMPSHVRSACSGLILIHQQNCCFPILCCQ